ncbi:hypothetical protein, conserved [Trypanosoma brucei gambiense DAL972]|uniref:Uncharacterized protein n=1 Tax=Trypanosoma brucei gambiense (strain MHOM/CI/86/DAL972) TaxID=679716 RepID=C9ZQD0_TRYB9|nr:hypothetical protein, conserved [Trypanosoma brucei gambiense DAL972]CBH11610.1 hypothetical protein, conserved [Trypanosoma brucei gambiense DAL972]|eukprot:XP_011773895.1 hypothetical protein, conserved [Trypanosoma brucei gambiense DAL972]
MTDFGREAAKLLRATEDALYYRRSTAGSCEWADRDLKFRTSSSATGDMRGNSNFPFEAAWRTDNDGEKCGDSAAYIIELQRQLRVVMSEVAGLRSELAAERDSRSSTLTALGRRWKEEVLVEVRTSEHQSRRAIDELSVAIQQQRKDEETARSLLQHRVEDLLRDSKVRDRTQFDMQEQLREQVDAMRERLESAVSECALLRVECVQHQERENSAIAQRLDAELMRYIDMRAEEQRERQQLKQQLKSDVEAFGTHVQELVDKTWKSHLATTRRELQAPIDTLVKQMAQHTEGMTDLSAKVHDCTTTCRAELRLQTTALQERVSAAEASAAVMLSRIDRAERKADGAQEAASRADATIAVVRDVAERAVVVSQRAMATAQRAEDAIEDRDARVAQLESHLAAVSTAEKLRADLEGVRRTAQRAESGVDALRHVYERDVQEQQNEKRQLDALMDRVSVYEKQQQHLRTSLESITDNRIPQLQHRIVVLEEARETLAAEASRGENAIMQNQQHALNIEGTVRSLNERLEQLRRDMNVSSQALSTRVEAANDAALRCETSSSTSRGEVERMERRVAQLEVQSTRLVADLTNLRSTADDNAKDTQTLSAQLQQHQRLWQEQRESRRELEATAIATNEAEIAAEQMAGRLEVKFNQHMRRVETNMAERTDKLEARANEASSRLDRLEDKGQSTSSLVTQVGETVQQQQQQFARDLQACRAKIDALNGTLTEIDEASERRFKDCVLQQDLNAIRRAVRTLETELHTIGADVTQHKQWAGSQEDCSLRIKRLEDEHRRQQNLLGEMRETLREVHDELKETQHFTTTLSQSVCTKEVRATEKGDGWPSQIPRVEKALFDSHRMTSSSEGQGNVASTPVIKRSTAGESLVAGLAPNVLAGTSMRRVESDPSQLADSPEPQKPPRLSQSSDSSLISQGKRLLSPALPTKVESTAKEGNLAQTGSTVQGSIDDKKPPSASNAKSIIDRPTQSALARKVEGSSSDSTVNTLEMSVPIDKRGPIMFAPRESSSSASSAEARQPQQKQHRTQERRGDELVRANVDATALPVSLKPSGSNSSSDSITRMKPSVEKTLTPPSSSKDTAVMGPILTVSKADSTREEEEKGDSEAPKTKVTVSQYDDWDDDSEDHPTAPMSEPTRTEAPKVDEKEEETKEVKRAEGKKAESDDLKSDLSVGNTGRASNVPPETGTDEGLGSIVGSHIGRRGPFQPIEDPGEDISFTVPRHGVSTASSDSSTKSKEAQKQKPPAVKQFTSFDDSSSEEEGA